MVERCIGAFMLRDVDLLQAVYVGPSPSCQGLLRPVFCSSVERSERYVLMCIARSHELH